jgi:hypothetical protein
MDFARRDSDVRVLYLDFKVVDPVQAARILDLVSAQAPPDVTMILMSPRRDVVEAFIVERARIGADTLRIAWDVVSEDALDGTLELGLRDVSTGIAIRSETLFLEEIVEAVEARRDGRIDSVTASTIDRRQLLGQLLYRDVDGVMTNHPDVLYDLWQLTL